MERKRLQFDFTPDALRRLDELVALANTQTRAACVRVALRLLDQVLPHVLSGGSVFVRTKDGKSIPITII